MKKPFLLITPAFYFLTSFVFPFVYWPEMLNWPFIMSLGWIPYKDFTAIQTPLLPLSLVYFYHLVGFSPFSLHLFGSLILALCNLLLVFLAYKLTKKWLWSVVAGFLYIFLTLTFEGNTVWFDSLVTLFLLGVFYFQWSYLEKPQIWKMFASGILMGITLLTKQTAAFILPEFLLVLGYLFWQKHLKLKELIYLGSLFFLPILILSLIFLLILYSQGALSDFVNWAIKFSVLLPHQQNRALAPDLLLPTRRQIIMLIILAAVSLFATFKNKSFISFLLLSWIFLGYLFTIPRFEYFHLLPLLPFFLLNFILAINKTKIPLVCLLFLLLLAATGPVFRNTYLIGQRFLTNDTQTVANWLIQNKKERTIFSLNGPDLVYFLTQKPPALRPWVDQLPWEMDYYGDKFYQQIVAAPPDIVVFHPYLTEPVNGLGAYQPKAVVEFVFSHYSLIKEFPDGVKILERT